MKRKGLLICTLFAVLLLTVSFSLPVFAETYTDVTKITTDVYPGTYYLNVSSDGFYEPFVLDQPLNSNGDYTFYGNTYFYNNSGSLDITYSINCLIRLPANFSFDRNYTYMRFNMSSSQSFLPHLTFNNQSDLEYSCVCALQDAVLIYGGQEYHGNFSNYGTSNYVSFDVIFPINASAIGQASLSCRFDYKLSLYVRPTTSGNIGTRKVTLAPQHTINFGSSNSSGPFLFSYYYSNDAESYQIQKTIKEQTQKQTDSLENGYDNSGLNQSNSNLSGAIADYDSTESQITDSSVANIDAAAFVSPASNATLLASISFCTSWLQSLFVNLGDWSLLVTVSLSLALGLMLIGWFKYR